MAGHANGWSASRVEPRRLCHLVLNTARFDQVVEFYTGVLGFRVSDWIEDQMAFLRCGRKHHVLSFNRAPQIRKVMAGDPDPGWAMTHETPAM